MKSPLTHSRPSRSLLAAAAVAGALALSGVHAQGYTGPSTDTSSAQRGYTGSRTDSSAAKRGYAGPSTMTATTVKALLDTGRDDQRAMLRGRIVSWDGGKHYTFEDETGQIRLEASRKYFPIDRDINEKTTVEIYGKLERDRRGVEFEAKQVIRIVP